jgi:hypothetical protein
MRKLMTLFVLIFALGCTSIRVHYPLLTEQNSHTGGIPEGYYLMYGPLSSGDPSDAYKVENAGTYAGKSASNTWRIQGWKSDAYYLVRFRATPDVGRYLVQLNSVSNGNSSSIVISFAELVSDSKIVIYAPNESALQKAKTSSYLSSLRGHYTVDDEDDQLSFDEIACVRYEQNIFNFMNSLNTSDFTVHQTAIKTTDYRLVDAIWAKKRREDSE